MQFNSVRHEVILLSVVLFFFFVYACIYTKPIVSEAAPLPLPPDPPHPHHLHLSGQII